MLIPKKMHGIPNFTSRCSFARQLVLLLNLMRFVYCLCDQKRASGDPYLQHCVETAVHLANIGANATVVSAGLLHDTIDDSFMDYDHIFRMFGAGVADLVEGVGTFLFTLS